MNFIRYFDWFTAFLYLILVLFGWATINAASYNFDGASILDITRNSGRQLMWFGMALFLIVVILCIDVKTYMTYSPLLYFGIMLVLLVTIFVAPDIKGSHSWLRFGSCEAP